MQSKLLSRRDIDFLLYEWLDVESLSSIRARSSDIVFCTPERLA
eukprot:gene38844-47969_t